MTDDAISIDAMKANLAILRHCKEKKAELDELEQNAKAAIQAALGDHEIGLIDGQPAVTWKYVRRNAIDQKALKQRYPEIAAEVMAVSESRRFEVARND